MTVPNPADFAARLARVEAQVEDLRTSFGLTQLDALRVELGALRTEMRAGFAAVNGRLASMEALLRQIAGLEPSA